VLATRSGPALCGLATGFAASIVMLGSWLAGPAVVCDAAGSHSNAIDRIAAAEGATKLDDSFMTMSSQGRTRRPNTYSAP